MTFHMRNTTKAQRENIERQLTEAIHAVSRDILGDALRDQRLRTLSAIPLVGRPLVHRILGQRITAAVEILVEAATDAEMKLIYDA